MVELVSPESEAVLLASCWRGGETENVFAPFRTLPTAPPFQSEIGQRYWYSATLNVADGATMGTALGTPVRSVLTDQVASCHGHVLEDAGGHVWGYVLALDQGAIADDPAATMFVRLVAERISARHVRSSAALKPLKPVKSVKPVKPLLLDRSANYDLALFDSSPIGISITDAKDGTIRYVNKWWCETYGMAIDKIVGTDIGDYYPDSAVRQNLANRMRRDGFVYNEEIEVLSLNSKTPIWILLSLYPITFEGEDAILAWTYDINERRQAETELRTSEQRFRYLAEGSIQGIVVVNQDFGPLYANQALADIFGYPSPDTILSWNSLAPFYGQAEVDRIQEIVHARFNSDPAPVMYEAEGRRKNGTVVWVQILARLVEWEHQPAIQATVIDITERKEVEDALRNSEKRFHDFA